MFDGAAAAIFATAADGCAVAAAGVELTGPGVAGAVWTGRLACGNWAGGFGPKNFAHSRITPTDSSDATRIRSSGVNLSFCPGKLTNAPHSGQRQSTRLNSSHSQISYAVFFLQQKNRAACR